MSKKMLLCTDCHSVSNCTHQVMEYERTMGTCDRCGHAGDCIVCTGHRFEWTQPGQLTPREYTTEEMRTRFIEHVCYMVDYWDKEDRCMTQRERLSGLAFSILSSLDGSSCDLPGFLVVPNPHPDDKQFNIDEGYNWVPVPCRCAEKTDIGGYLHELFHSTMRDLGLE